MIRPINITLMHSQKLKEQILEFIKYHDVKPITKESYRRILLRYVEYVEHLSEPPIRDDVKQYRDTLIKDHSANTVQKYIVVVRLFYAWLYAEGKGDNIAINIKGPRIENTFKRESLSEKQARQLLEYAKNESSKGIIEFRNFAMIALMISTGFRTIEIERADVSDIHFIGDSHVLYVMGKGRDEKDSYNKLSPLVYKLIESYLMMRSDEHKPLFINHGSTYKEIRLKTRSISKIVKKYLLGINIDSKKFTAHSLRHTAATLAMEKGADLYSAQHMLRHKNTNTTKIYLHKINRRKEKYEEIIGDDLLKGLT
jgi:site-specific recombinase XerD